MPLKKIISGGQTGADQGALDAAIKMNIPHGGWIPKGRMTENGPLSSRYTLKEMETKSYPARTEKNVLDSDGTLILSHGKLSGGSLLTRKLAVKHNRPVIHIDLYKIPAFEAVLMVFIWLVEKNIETLNVAGARASKNPDIYQATRDILESVCELSIAHEKGEPYAEPPATIDEAVDRLIATLDLREKSVLTRMSQGEIDSLYTWTANYFKIIFGPWIKCQSLLRSCRFKSGKTNISKDDATRIILDTLWEELRKTHQLKIVK